MRRLWIARSNPLVGEGLAPSEGQILTRALSQWFARLNPLRVGICSL